MNYNDLTEKEAHEYLKREMNEADWNGEQYNALMYAITGLPKYKKIALKMIQERKAKELAK